MGLTVPANNLTDYDEIKAAYHASKSFVSIDQSLSNHLVDKTPYLTLTQVSDLLDTLEKLCHDGMEMTKAFKQIEGYRSKLKPGLQSYIKLLSTDKNRVTVKQSLAELVALKTNFLDATIISGSMHIHNMNSSVLSCGLTLVKATLEKYAGK